MPNETESRRVAWTDALEYFGHLDATLSGVVLDVTARTASVALSYWPHWLHPKWQRVTEDGLDWRLNSDGLQEIVVVEAVGLIESHLVCADGDDVLDAGFVRSGHRRQWGYEATSRVMSNQAIRPVDVIELAASVAAPLRVPSWEVLRYMPPLDGRTAEWSNFSLGDFPITVLNALLPELERRRIGFSTFGPSDPRPGTEAVPTLFCFDDSYLLADKFDVVLPNFEMPDDAVTLHPRR